MPILNGFDKSDYANCREYQNAPCYRSLISIAFFEYYLHCLIINDVKEEIINFITCVRECEKYILIYEFDEDEPTFLMEFYPLEFLEGQGAVYIDHTHTCYPLILYPQAHKVKTSTRIDGFLHAVESVNGEIDKLLNLCLEYETIRYLEDKDKIKLNRTKFHTELHSFIHNRHS